MTLRSPIKEGCTSRLRGHEIELVEGEWVYKTDQTPTAGSDRNCGFCQKPRTPEGHDGCAGTLPGVKNACCGHGDPDEAYVQFENGTELRDAEAHAWIESHGGEEAA